MNPSYSEFLEQLTNDLISIKGDSVGSLIEGEYFIFYLGEIQISQFKLSLYDKLLKYNDYTYVYNYFKNYILNFIGGGGESVEGDPIPLYKIQNKIIVG